MHAPLARHLSRFQRPASDTPLVPIAVDRKPERLEPTVTMTVAALEARLDAARDAMRALMDAEKLSELQRADAAHAEALMAAVAEATARRDVEEGGIVAAQITAAMQSLHGSLAEQLASTLRPLLVEAAAARAVAALVETVQRLLSDVDCPAMTIRGPEGLMTALEAALGSTGVTFVVTAGDEVTVAADGIRIETRLAAALAALAATEGA